MLMRVVFDVGLVFWREARVLYRIKYSSRFLVWLYSFVYKG